MIRSREIGYVPPRANPHTVAPGDAEREAPLMWLVREPECLCHQLPTALKEMTCTNDGYRWTPGMPTLRFGGDR